MLHLYRRPGERIVIQENVWLQIVSVVSNRVELEIEAPQVIDVYREEVWQTLYGHTDFTQAKPPYA